MEEAGRARRRRWRVGIADQLDQRRVGAERAVDLAQADRALGVVDRTRSRLVTRSRTRLIMLPRPRGRTSSRIASTSPGASQTCIASTSTGDVALGQHRVAQPVDHPGRERAVGQHDREVADLLLSPRSVAASNVSSSVPNRLEDDEPLA